MTDRPALAWHGVTRRYRAVTALDDLTLELAPGRIHGLLGPNGSGKTTAMRTVLGLTSIDQGRVHLLGAAPTTASRRKVGYLPESCRLPEEDQVRGLLTMMLQLRGWSRGDASGVVGGWLERLGLADKAGARMSALSKGQQQRVQIALTLAHEPEVLILDEPFTGLDVEYQNLLGDLIREASERGATVVLCTHRLRQAQALIDDVVLFSGGQMVLQGELAGLRRRQHHRYRVRAGAYDWIEGPDVSSISEEEQCRIVTLVDGADASQLFARAGASGQEPDSIERVQFDLPTLFLEHVGREP